jgi:streptogramin lyase
MGNDLEAFPVDGALATDTSLHHASDVELDGDGNLYVADNHAPYVFRVGSDDRVHIIAGTGEAGYDGDGGPAQSAKLTAPFGVFPTADGGVYVADSAVHVVRYINPEGIINTVAGTGPNPGTRAGGYSGDDGPATQAQLNGPTRIRLDNSGNLFICDTNNHVIRRLDASGIITTVAGTGVAGYSGDNGPATTAQFNTPYDLRLTADGTMYVADAGNNVIRRIDPNGVVTTVVGTETPGFAGDQGDARDCQLKFPVGIEIAPDGALWISDTFNQRVRRVAGFIR